MEYMTLASGAKYLLLLKNTVPQNKAGVDLILILKAVNLSSEIILERNKRNE